MKRLESGVTCLVVACITLLMGATNAAALDAQSEKKSGFNPKDIDHLALFLESIKGVAVATNTSQEAYKNLKERTPLKDVWADLKRFPQGSVRQWMDQSDYVAKKIHPGAVFKTGRELGQDDHDRPGYIPDGCNGKPCLRGGLIGTEKGELHNKQPCYLELQVGNRDFQIDGPWSIFLLAKPVQQEKEHYVFLGSYGWGNVGGTVSDNSVTWKNVQWQIHKISKPNALKLDTWQLIEVHRDKEGALTCVINGKDVTEGSIVDTQPLKFMYLFNNGKGQADRPRPFIGDIAGLVIYAKTLNAEERAKVRDYFNAVYEIYER